MICYIPTDFRPPREDELCQVGFEILRAPRDCHDVRTIYKPIVADVPALIAACRAGSKALRSYQYGNSAPDLADGIATAMEKALASVKEPTHV